jgi:hypothetical protein
MGWPQAPWLCTIYWRKNAHSDNLISRLATTGTINNVKLEELRFLKKMCVLASSQTAQILDLKHSKVFIVIKTLDLVQQGGYSPHSCVFCHLPRDD